MFELIKKKMFIRSLTGIFNACSHTICLSWSVCMTQCTFIVLHPN